MFNAPRLALALGHDPDRALRLARDRLSASRKLTRGETAADRRNSGNPNGIDLRRAVGQLEARSDDLAGFLIDYICNSTGCR